MKTHHFIWILAGVTFTGLLRTSAATAQMVVVSPAGLADTEGNREHAPVPFPDGFRVQQLHPAADFVAIEGGRFQIVRIAFRPDHTAPEAHAFEWEVLEIKLSTTAREPGGLADKFRRQPRRRRNDSLFRHCTARNWGTARRSTQL